MVQLDKCRREMVSGSYGENLSLLFQSFEHDHVMNPVKIDPATEEGKRALCIYLCADRCDIGGVAVAVLLSSMPALAIWYVNIRRQIGLTKRERGLLFAPPTGGISCHGGCGLPT